MSSELFYVVLDDEVVTPTGANGLDGRFRGVEKQNPLPLRLNLRLRGPTSTAMDRHSSLKGNENSENLKQSTHLDDNVPDFEIGAVVDADVATERLSQVNRPVKRRENSSNSS